MKKYQFLIVLSICLSNLVYSQLTPVPNAEKMIKKYNHRFANHKRTDGVVIDTIQLKQLITYLKADRIKLVYARYLDKNDVPTDNDAPNKKKKKRTTILIAAYGPKFKASPVYYDLGRLGDICPEPPNCEG